MLTADRTPQDQSKQMKLIGVTVSAHRQHERGVDFRTVYVADGEGLPRERSECFGHDLHWM